jgi:transposase
MKKNKQLYLVSEEMFNEKILPVIEGNYIRKGHPPKVPRYQAICGIPYILGTGRPLRDLPGGIRHWHVIYDRFSRGNGRELRAKVLLVLDESSPSRGRQSKGRSWTGITAKFHAAVTDAGCPVEGFLGGENAADITASARPTRDITGSTVIFGMGYDSDRFRRGLGGGGQ